MRWAAGASKAPDGASYFWISDCDQYTVCRAFNGQIWHWDAWLNPQMAYDPGSKRSQRGMATQLAGGLSTSKEAQVICEQHGTHP